MFYFIIYYNFRAIIIILSLSDNADAFRDKTHEERWLNYFSEKLLTKQLENAIRTLMKGN